MGLEEGGGDVGIGFDEGAEGVGLGVVELARPDVLDFVEEGDGEGFGDVGEVGSGAVAESEVCGKKSVRDDESREQELRRRAH